MVRKINQLENTILDIGTEIYRLRNEMKTVNDFNQRMVKIMAGLRAILDDKGLITTEDFDSAVELGDAINMVAGPSAAPVEAPIREENFKKNIH